MIGQDRDELLLVLRLEEFFDRSVRKPGESIVSRREHSEGAGTGERIDKAGGLYCRDEGVERAIADGGLNYVWFLGRIRRGQGQSNRNSASCNGLQRAH